MVATVEARGKYSSRSIPINKISLDLSLFYFYFHSLPAIVMRPRVTLQYFIRMKPFAYLLNDCWFVSGVELAQWPLLENLRRTKPRVDKVHPGFQ